MAHFTKIKANNKQGFKWLCVMEGPPDPATGKRQQVPRRADTKGEAEKRAQEAVNALKGGMNTRIAKRTKFNAVAEEWLEAYEMGDIKASTVRTRKNQLKIANKHLGHLSIDKITHEYYQKVVKSVYKEGYSKGVIEGVNSTINQIFKFAIKNKLRLDNPVTGVIIPKRLRTVEEIENETIEEKYFETHEIEEFLKASREHGLDQDMEIFYLMTFSGMRPGEVCALKWTDINFETNEVRVTKTLYNPTNKMEDHELTPPKTKGSVRTFDVDESVIALLHKHKEQQAYIHKQYDHYHDDYYKGNFIFCRSNGRPFIQNTLVRRMARLLEKTSIQKKATPHILRHTHVSMWAEAGVDLKTIMQRVGHENPRTTLKIYTHVTDKMRKSATDKIKVKFGNVLDF